MLSPPPPPPPGAAAPVSCHPSWDGVPRAPRHPQGCGEPEVLVLQLCCSSKLANTHPKCGGQRWQTPSNLLLIGSPVVLLIPHCPHPPRTSCRTSPSMRTRSNPPGSNPHHPFPPTSNSVLTTPPPHRCLVLCMTKPLKLGVGKGFEPPSPAAAGGGGGRVSALQSLQLQGCWEHTAPQDPIAVLSQLGHPGMGKSHPSSLWG